MRPRIEENPNWCSYLSEVLLDVNTTWHSAIGMTPWYIENGRNYLPPSPDSSFEKQLHHLLEARRAEEGRIETKEEIIERASKNLEKAAERMRRKQSNSKVITFKEGDAVLIKKANCKRKRGEKLFPYEGVISRVSQHGRYKVRWKTSGPLEEDEPGKESNRW